MNTLYIEVMFDELIERVEDTKLRSYILKKF